MSREKFRLVEPPMSLMMFLEQNMKSYSSDMRITKIDQIAKVLNREAYQCDCDLLSNDNYHDLHRIEYELLDECFKEAFENLANLHELAGNTSIY